MNSKKNASVSFTRMIAMVLIIACHFFQFYENELCRWLNVGVQIFFVISGFLYSNKVINDPIEFLKRTCKRVLVPYYTFLFPVSALYFFFARDSITLSTFIKATFCAATIQGLGHLWFVGYIILCYFLTPYLYWLKQTTDKLSIVRTILIFCCILIGVQILGVLFDSYFKPDRVSCYFVGYFLGILQVRMDTGVKKKLYLYIVLFSLLISLVRVYFCYLSGTHLSPAVLTALIHYAHMFMGIALFLILMQFSRKKSYNSILNWSDKYSYHVYLVHLLFIISPFSLMRLSGVSVLNWCVVILLIILSAILLQRISNLVIQKI